MAIPSLITSVFITWITLGPLGFLVTTTEAASTPSGLQQLRFFVISDLDERARQEEVDSNGNKTPVWVAYLRQGTVTYDPNGGENPSASIEFNPGHRTLKSGADKIAGNRGMEMSILNKFNGKLYTCDDRSGQIYEVQIDENDTEKATLKEWVKLAEAGGKDNNTTARNRGFKCEWATVKDGKFWVGGHGSKQKNENYMNVNVISPNGDVELIHWKDNYVKIAGKLGVDAIRGPGYVTHEACNWSDILKKWVFLPRKISHVKFSDKEDETKSANQAILADEDFSNIEVRSVGPLEPLHGFSSFKFLPGTGDQAFIAVKSEETATTQASFMLVADLDGEVWYPETEFEDNKYEGVELYKRRRRGIIA